MNPWAAMFLLRRGQLIGWLIGAAVLILLSPLIVAASFLGLLTEEASAVCTTTPGAQPPAGGQLAAGLYAQPLILEAGRSYEVGATEYGGPGDPSSGDYGSIPNPGQSYLPAHPDSFAELSVLSKNPANSESFTFADADALDQLPYLTGLWVSHNGRRLLLDKRDIGYGQGPGQWIANGEPYRLDVWWQAAAELGISKSAVQIQLAPATGAGATLEDLPVSGQADPGAEGGADGCAAEEAGSESPLPLTAGAETKILPNGLAAAGEEAPPQVKAMVAAANRLYGTAYLYGGAHGTPLSAIEPAYDCSSAVSYVLYVAGLLGGEYAWDSSELEHYGEPGPGRYVTIYANAAHVFIYIGGLRFDTVYAYDNGPNAGKSGPRWRVYPEVPDWSTWVVRHPPGL